jgi:hypothetical protein
MEVVEKKATHSLQNTASWNMSRREFGESREETAKVARIPWLGLHYPPNYPIKKEHPHSHNYSQHC